MFYLQIDTSYPRTISNWWLGCPDREQIKRINQVNSQSSGYVKQSADIELSQVDEAGILGNVDTKPQLEVDSNTEQFVVEDTVDRTHDAQSSGHRTVVASNIYFLLIFFVHICFFHVS